ncbi:MAG: hypothetical protein JW862_03775 [Anaerolineales bacterium]|nr:hypothetical protein [Anaerolineales bacterium]
MKSQIKNGFQVGLIFSFVIFFFFLIGFTITMSEIIGDVLPLDSAVRSGHSGGLIVFFVLLGMWAGSRAVGEGHGKWHAFVLPGLVAGLTIGLLIGGSSLAFGYLDAADVDMRQYFVQLSRPSIQLLLYGNSPWVGAVLNLVIFTLSGAFGSLLSYGSAMKQSGEKASHWAHSWRETIQASQFARNYRENLRFRWGVYAFLLLFLFILPLFLGKYWNYAMGTVGIYVLMGLGLNIVVGLAGLLDLGYVAFFAIGAYTVGLLTAPAPLGIEVNFWLAMLISVIMAAFAGILLGIPVLRMRGDYLAIVTLGFGEIIRVLVKSDIMTPYLGGPQGVRDIGGPAIFGLSLNSEQAFMYLIILAIILVIFLTNRLQTSRIGRAWVAMREDETVAQAMGINTLTLKLMAFSTGAAFAGLGGALFASRNQYTGPEDHSLMVSINVLCLLIVGGMGSIPGVILGAFVLKGLPELLRELELFRFLAFGALLVVMMIWRPEGLWPAPRRRLELHEDQIRGDEELPALAAED